MAFVHKSNRDLDPYFVSWDHVTEKDTRRLQRCIDRARDEATVHSFLEKYPEFLIQHLGGGHGRWVISKKRLGAEYVPDFLIGERYSYGFDWYAVELESPRAPMFTKRGDPSQRLVHAIRQIQDWRAWLGANQGYAVRAREESGLGLTGIGAKLPGLIIIGRRGNVDPKVAALRRQMMHDLAIKIHTFDYLVDSLAGRVDALDRSPRVRTSRSVGAGSWSR